MCINIVLSVICLTTLLNQVSLSTKQDDFVILHVTDSYDSLLKVPLKTEMVTVLKKLKESQGMTLRVVCHDR